MNRPMVVDLDQHAIVEIERLVCVTGKPEKLVLCEVVTHGLKTYPTNPTQSAQAVLDLIERAEYEQIAGQTTDLSTNHNTYAWET